MPDAPNSNRQHGSAKESCPLAKGALHVTVLESGTQREVDGVDVTLVQKGASQASDAKGLASFKGLDPGAYDVKIALGKLESQYSVAADSQSQGVAGGDESSVIFWIDPLGELQVKVIRTDTKEALASVKLQVTGPQTLDGQTAGSSPLASFRNLKPGEYTVAVMSMGQHAEELEPPSDTSATVPGGGLKQVVLEVGPTAWIEIVLVGEDDKPIPGERYRLKLPDGTIKEGELDANGYARFEGIARGQCKVSFPDLDRDAWEKT